LKIKNIRLDLCNVDADWYLEGSASAYTCESFAAFPIPITVPQNKFC